MKQDPRPIKIFARYELAAKHWKPFKPYDYRMIGRASAPKVDPGDLLEALTFLYAKTGLKCFGEAGDFLLKSSLTDPAAWHWRAITPDIDDDKHQSDNTAIKMVIKLMEGGMSRRLAMANAAANLRWPGNSFDAAVKSIERLCQDASRRKDQTTPAGKCPKTSGL